MKSDNGEQFNGVTLRDYFAAKVLNGIIGSLIQANQRCENSELAQNAYRLADAMIKERNKSEEES